MDRKHRASTLAYLEELLLTDDLPPAQHMRTLQSGVGVAPCKEGGVPALLMYKSLVQEETREELDLINAGSFKTALKLARALKYAWAIFDWENILPLVSPDGSITVSFIRETLKQAFTVEQYTKEVVYLPCLNDDHCLMLSSEGITWKVVGEDFVEMWVEGKRGGVEYLFLLNILPSGDVDLKPAYTNGFKKTHFVHRKDRIFIGARLDRLEKVEVEDLQTAYTCLHALLGDAKQSATAVKQLLKRVNKERTSPLVLAL